MDDDEFDVADGDAVMHNNRRRTAAKFPGFGEAAPRRVPLALPAPDVADGSSSSSNSSSNSEAKSSQSSLSFDIATGRGKMSMWISVAADGCLDIKVDHYKPRRKAAYTRLIGRCVHHPDCAEKTVC